MDIKELLYNEINQIGINYIKTKINSSILNSENIIVQILDKCFEKMSKDNFSESDILSLAEALMHFLLTISIIPTERKITINNIEVSILVPNVKGLKIDSSKVLVIQFINENTLKSISVLNNLLKIQPHKENIWLVSYAESEQPPKFRNFVINYRSRNTDYSMPFSQILIEINGFLDKIEFSGFRII